MRLHSYLCATAILAFAACLESGAQTGPVSESKTPSYRSTTRAVVVDVVVSKGDDAVRGLNRRDFQILEDSKPQTIDFFEEHSANTLPAGTLPPLPQMPAGVYTNVPAAPENDSVNVLLLDALNTDKEDQIYVHNQIITFLKNMQPGTRAAIFTLSSRLRMVQGFTTDSTALHVALNDPKYGVGPEKPHESHSIQDKIDDVQHIGRMVAMDNGHWTEGISAVQSFQRDMASFQMEQRISMTLEALQALARYLEGVPGRKNLIWFSSSFPVAVFPKLGQTQHPNRMNTDSMREYGTEVRETANLLTASKIAVYPVGAEGVMSEHIFEANLQTPTDYEGMEQSGAGKGSGVMDAYNHENGARSDKIMSMEQLAQDTGGKAFFNTNDLAAAAQKAIADGAHYYTIAYTPTNKKMDGSYRKIEVKVPDEKYRLAYRHGYNADDLPSAADAKPEADPLHALMMRGMPDATQLLFAARVLPATPQPAASAPHAGRNSKLAGPTTRYSIDFMIRWTDVKLDVQPDGAHTGKIDVQLLAYDREGNALNWAGGTQMMSLKPDIFAAIQKSGIPAHIDIDLPADKDVYLVAGVYDWQTGKAGTMEVPLLAPEQSKTTQAKTENSRH
jgi:VWFA-related protein